MKGMKLFFAVALFGIMASCTGGQKKTDTQQQDSTRLAADMHTSEIAIDYYGTYEGTLPCADCEGIKTKLTINEDNTFVLNSEYLGKKDGKFEDKGSYIIENGNVLVTQDETGEQKYYQIQEGSLAMLDADKKMIQGELAPNYILKKIQ